MISKLLSALIAVTLFCFPAAAFDFAKREIIGFSADGNFFAFEQYGTQDGSGFAYSDIFIIDTRDDEWVKGSPYRYLLKDEQETLSLQAGIMQARQINRAAAKRALSVITEPGIIAATNRVDEETSDPYSISISPKSFFLPNDVNNIRFQVETLKLRPAQYCLDFDLGNDYVGYRLLRSDDGNSPVIMHEDKSIPKSRKCPLDYEPSDVVFHITNKGKFSVAVLIRMKRLGFEGPDRRFLAVTGQLN